MTKKYKLKEILMGLAVAVFASTAFADEVWTGDLVQGFIANLQTTNQAKFQEYLATPDGATMNGNLNFDGSGGVMDLDWAATSGFNRKADLDFEVDNNLTGDVNFKQFQHLYTNTASTMFTQTSPDVFTLPGSIQQANQGQSSAVQYQNLLNQQNATGQTVSVGLQDSIMNALVKYQVDPNFEVEVGGNQKWTTGSRPLGTIGSTEVELPDAVNETTTEGNVRAEYDGKDYAVRVNYDVSSYNNSLPSMIFSNPIEANSIPGASSIEQISNAPSNMSNRFTLSAETDIIPQTRLNGDMSLGYDTQNQPFIPYTLNAADTVGTGGPAANLLSSLPQASLNGCLQTFAQNYVVTSRPENNFVITLRYKDYELADMTSNIGFPGWVNYDGSWSAINSAENGGIMYNDNYSSVDQTLSGNATWTALKGVDVNGGYSSEFINYTDREVEATCEETWKAGLDLKPLKGIDLKSDYTYSQRYASNDNYLIADDLNGTTTNLGGTSGLYGEVQNPGLRRYDVADRQVNDLATRLTLTVVNNVWFACKWTTGTENYLPGNDDLAGNVAGNIEQQYGLTGDNHDFLTFTAHWQPFDRLDLSGTVDQQIYNYTQVGCTSTSAQTAANTWTLTDEEQTLYYTFAGDFTVTPKFVIDASWTLTNGNGNYAFNEGSGTGGIAGNSTLPTVVYWMEDFNLGLTYHFNDTWSVRGSYLLENYNENDFQTDNVQVITQTPATEALGGIFLGGQNAPYTAQQMSVVVMAKL